MNLKLNGIDPYSSILGDSTEFSLAQALFQPPATNAQSMDATIKGGFNGKIAINEQHEIQKSDLSLEFSAEGMFNMTNANAGGGFTFAMDMRQPDQDNIFLRITKVPQLGLFDTNAIVNKWIKYPQDQGLYTGSVDQNKQEELTKKLTDQVLQSIWEKYRPTLFILARGNQDKTINQIRTKHISYTVDVAVLKPFLREIFEAYAQYNRELTQLVLSESASDYYSSDDYLQSQIDARDKQVNDIINSIQQISGNIWIGADFLPYAYDMQADFAYSQDRITSEVSVILSSEATSYNQDFVVESPTDAVTPEELVSQLQPEIDPVGQFQDSQDARVLSSAAQLRTSLELYNAEYGVYPQRLTELNDYGYRALVQDVQDSGLITYRQTEIGKNYQMCVTLSDLSQQCTDEDQNIRSGVSL
ncbi:MAG: hypothetical protein KatS3mg087_0302 [Patescibacteria group bacterium]|nr:MAG: hypothetical protein KatS3mg087_0302 [Patescibacteria group bacterium]